MASNDDLDDFFKKKDRKGNKTKKPSGILSNNKELLKQLEIVTSATSAFKENPDLLDDEEEVYAGDEVVPAVVPTSAVLPTKSDAVPLTLSKDAGQDEWEEFEASNPKYEELRAKLSRVHDQEDPDNDSDHSLNADEHNENAHDREQQKEKRVWKLDQVKGNEPSTNTNSNNHHDGKEEEAEEKPAPPPAAKPSTASTYRPPHLRSGNAVTIVSGISSSGPSKKKQPNLASTEEFPSLGAAVNKK